MNEPCGYLRKSVVDKGDSSCRGPQVGAWHVLGMLKMSVWMGWNEQWEKN